MEFVLSPKTLFFEGIVFLSSSGLFLPLVTSPNLLVFTPRLAVTDLVEPGVGWALVLDGVLTLVGRSCADPFERAELFSFLTRAGFVAGVEVDLRLALPVVVAVEGVRPKLELSWGLHVLRGAGEAVVVVVLVEVVDGSGDLELSMIRVSAGASSATSLSYSLFSCWSSSRVLR